MQKPLSVTDKLGPDRYIPDKILGLIYHFWQIKQTNTPTKNKTLKHQQLRVVISDAWNYFFSAQRRNDEEAVIKKE